MAGFENVDVRPIEGEELQAAARVAARGMRDNPLHVAAIGDNPASRVQVMYRVFSRLLPLPGRPTLGAWDGDRLVGVADSAERALRAVRLPGDGRVGRDRGQELVHDP